FFDNTKNIAYNKKDTTSVPIYIQDILSIFYFIRTQNLKLNSEIEIPNFDNGKVFNVKFKVQRIENISVDAGKFNCIVLEPSLNSKGKVKPKGTMTLWLTNDKKKIPVLIKTRIKAGTMTAKLKKIEGL
ncbi:DUF3108 domain-containing protein, partial [candidate division KSB1 bacterium]